MNVQIDPTGITQISKLAMAGVFSPLAAVLQQLDAVLQRVSDPQYVQNPVGAVSGSLGGHVRHCLDHVEALLAAIESGEIDYDHRQRGTCVETDRWAARQAIGGLLDRLQLHDEGTLDRPARMTAMLSADGFRLQAESTIGRELIFVLSHTIHHNALISAICKTLGIPLPLRFGYAPATIAHLDRPACVR